MASIDRNSGNYQLSIMEIYKDIIGYEGLYAISNLGNIKRLSSIVILSNGVSRLLSTKILRPSTTAGYKSIVLSKNNIKTTYRIHRLVAEAYIDNVYNKPCVNHINGIKHDNRVENLEWVTYSENTIHSFVNGLQIPIAGENHSSAKLLDKEVIEIRKEYSAFLKDISLRFNISSANVRKIINNTGRLSVNNIGK
jgi:hypothetical protein